MLHFKKKKKNIFKEGGIILLILLIVMYIKFFIINGGEEPRYYPEMKSEKEIQIEILENNNEKIRQQLAKLELENQEEIARVKRELETEIIRVKKEDEQAENRITNLNKHLKNKFARKGEVFYYAGVLYNVNPELLTAIAIHETGNGSSKAVVEKNNVGGIMDNAEKGVLAKFEDVDMSIVEMARILKKYYIDQGRNTIELIGDKYCPVDAANDKAYGLNKHWIPRVTEIYNQIQETLKEKYNNKELLK